MGPLTLTDVNRPPRLLLKFVKNAINNGIIADSSNKFRKFAVVPKKETLSWTDFNPLQEEP